MFVDPAPRLFPLATFLFIALWLLVGLVPSLAAIEFKAALDNSPLDVTPPAGETVTDAVKQFHETGANAYAGNADAIEAGKELYNTNCQVCHGKTGGGGMGLNLVDDKVAYPRVTTDVGVFEVIYGGASGAMRGFKGRMTQDEILKVVGYVRSLKQ
jgi:cytochrome c-L